MALCRPCARPTQNVPVGSKCLAKRRAAPAASASRPSHTPCAFLAAKASRIHYTVIIRICEFAAHDQYALLCLFSAKKHDGVAQTNTCPHQQRAS